MVDLVKGKDIGSANAKNDINSLVAFNKKTTSFTETSGDMWLRSGYIDKNIASYPNAQVTVVANTFQQTSFTSAVINQSTMYDITKHGVNYWAITSTSTITEYNSTFSPTGNSWTLSGWVGSAYGITSDGTYLYISDNSGQVIHKVNPALSGASIGSGAFPTAVTTYYKWVYINTKLYTMNTDKIVYEYDLNLIPTGITFAAPLSALTSSSSKSIGTDGIDLIFNTNKGFTWMSVTGVQGRVETLFLAIVPNIGLLSTGSVLTLFKGDGYVMDKYTYDTVGGYSFVGNDAEITAINNDVFYKRVK